ncbi:hypothetical protein SAMN05421743_108151 [Thalassobacillus cyri]|uniref:TRAP transporter solute receptor, TAXI family n=1 Tax=Thalassobacillus cyri TaxID=571932 RepID=A0A1H4E5V5_9BACI|nr:TAXI family TRAP transporter solute-binding subunit [Thalassobacillus cyri]SEA80411.1 hypothetical protein SAMN05421743_108151 [Thalassobacillus cyri]
MNVHKIKGVRFLSTLLLLVGLLIGCSSQSSGNGDESGGGSGGGNMQTSNFNFGAATQGGFWYALGGAYANEIEQTIDGSSVNVIEGGSISNLKGIESGKFHMGFSNGQTVPEALNGENSFKKEGENITWAATLYPNVFHIVVPADSDIKSVEDLKGKKVSPGIKGYSGELAFKQILEINGMSYDDLAKVEYVGTADGASLLRDGHIDAVVGMISAPVSTFQELDTTFGIRLIPLKDETITKMKESNEGFNKYTIEAGVYENIDTDTNTVAAHTTFMVNEGLSEDTVYTLTKTLFENKKKWVSLNKMMESFNAEFSINNKIGPMHPGAEKYYKEAGLLGE